MNKVLLIGRLGRDPEVRYTASGQAVGTLNVATDESYKSQDGQRVEKTEWHRVIVWGKLAEFCGNYLSKGRLIHVEGKLETKKWQDKDGNDRTTTEIRASLIQALDSKRDGAKPAGGGNETEPPDDMDEAPF